MLRKAWADCEHLAWIYKKCEDRTRGTAAADRRCCMKACCGSSCRENRAVYFSSSMPGWDGRKAKAQQQFYNNLFGSSSCCPLESERVLLRRGMTLSCSFWIAPFSNEIPRFTQFQLTLTFRFAVTNVSGSLPVAACGNERSWCRRGRRRRRGTLRSRKSSWEGGKRGGKRWEGTQVFKRKR